MKFCPECGAKQEEEKAQEVEVIEKPEEGKEKASQVEVSKEETAEEPMEAQTNLERTTEVEINPDSQNITEEEMKNIGQ